MNRYQITGIIYIDIYIYIYIYIYIEREGGGRKEKDRGDNGKEGETERRVSGREWREGEVRREGKEQAGRQTKKGKGVGKKKERKTGRQSKRGRRERERENSNTLFYKDYSLGSVKNLTTSPC